MFALSGGERLRSRRRWQAGHWSYSDHWNCVYYQQLLRKTSRQGPVVELLTQWKAQISHENASGELCDAASRCYFSTFRKWFFALAWQPPEPLTQILTMTCSGDIDQIQRLINSKVDLNQGDYDSRTAIHLVIPFFNIHHWPSCLLLGSLRSLMMLWSTAGLLRRSRESSGIALGILCRY